ncbi:MAG TPA: 5-oxoprolinase subunit PxpB [Burkholderiales bacterium]|nr:5-oxoprolinase subunit PxpB [Burkholderiales bacterium]
MDVRFLSSGDTALVVEFGERIDRALNERVLRLNAAVRAARIPGIVETVPTFRSLMVHYDPLITANAAIKAAIERLLDHGAGTARQARRWRIPACYSVHHGPDLEDVAQRTGLETAEVIRLHSATRYQVYMVGFSPGFPYMGDLPQPLALPRRTDPRVRVPVGSIAIAAGMTAIYPVESPGGWHLIGATPVRMFELGAPQPALLAPGDEVNFEPVDEREYDAIQAAVAAGAYPLACEVFAS